jgi:hypothetical protein
MIDILVDINLTEATLKIGNDSLEKIKDTTGLRIRYAEVFRKNNVDPDDFNASLNYYLEHIDELDKIYTEVINRLSALEGTLQAKSNHENSARIRTNNIQIPMPNNIWARTLYKPTLPDDKGYFEPWKLPSSRKVKLIYPGPIQ